jgi:universal stress protein E
MITAEGRRDIRQMIFGRTSMHLMRKCPCPVWVFKPSQHLPHDRILAAIDPMPYDEKSDGLSRRILDLAVSLAQLDSADLYVVHAWAWLRVLGETRTLAFEPMDDCTLVSELRRIGRECIDRLLEKYEPKNARITIHTLEGCPEEVVPDFARTNEVDLIVMGTVHKIGLGGFFMGSTAETVLRNADCSVLTVKPDGFVSPIAQN